MVTIEKLTESDITDILNITLAEEQVKFAGTAEEFISDGSETTHLHVIKSDNNVVGFFKLDIAYASMYEFCSESGIGLRAFAIDVSQQGKGVGTASVKALFPYLKENYSPYDSIFLTVNCKNPGARICYQRGGFEDTGEKYLGGMAGPQYIMRGVIA